MMSDMFFSAVYYEGNKSYKESKVIVKTNLHIITTRNTLVKIYRKESK